MSIPISKPCGTRAAAQRHRRRGEPLCEPCVEAERTYYRERARIAYSIPAYRARENARTAARLRVRRANDPTYRQRVNEQRRRRRRLELEAERYDRLHRVDAVVVARLVDGERVPHNRPERLEAVRQLHERRYSYNEIAERLHVAQRQVHRDLNDLELVESRCAS